MATQLFLRNTASDLGGAGQKALSTSRGAASQTAITTTTASGTNIAVTSTAGGQALTWFSDALPGQTVTGTVDINIRGRESTTSVNVGAGIVIERVNSSGVVQSTILSDRTVPATITEYSTSDAAKSSTGLAITSTTFANGDRIKVTLKVRNVGTMAAGTATNTFDGPTSGAAGDTYVTFSQTIATNQNAGTIALSAQSSLTATAAQLYPIFIGAGTHTAGSGSTFSVPVPTGVQAGDLVIIPIFLDDNPSSLTALPTDFAHVTGSPQLAFPTGGSPNHSLAVVWKRATGADTGTYDFIISSSSTYRASSALLFRGEASTGSPFDVNIDWEYDATDTSTTTTPNVTITTTVPHGLLLFVGTDWSGGAWTINGGLTKVLDTGDEVLAAAIGDAVTTGSYGPYSGTSGNTNRRISFLASIAPPSTITVITGTATLTAQSTLSVTATNNVVGASVQSGQSTLTVSGTRGQIGVATLSAQSTLVASGTRGQFGSVALSSQSSLTAIGTIVKVGSATFSSDTSLIAIGTVGSSGTTASLSAQSTLAASAIVTEFPVSNLSGQSTLVASGTVTRLGTATLSSQSNMVASGAVIGVSVIALTGQSTLTISGTVTEVPVASLSSQSTMVVSGTIGRSAVANLSGQSSLTANGTVIQVPAIVLSGQSTLTASAVDTVPSGSIAINSQSTMVATAMLGAVPTTAFFSGQSTLTVSSNVIKLPSAGLSAQTNLSVVPTVTVKGNTALSVQSGTTVSALVTVITGIITPTVQSGMVVSGQKISVASASLSAQSTMAVNGKAVQFATALLTGASNLAVNEVVKQFVTVNFSAQSDLVADGFIPVFYFGSANFSVTATLAVDGNSAPPWVFPFIEFSSVTINTHSGGSVTVTAIEGSAGNAGTREGSDSVISIEGG